MRKWYFIVWALLFLFSFRIRPGYCWEVSKVDKVQIQELCGLSWAEYQAMREMDSSFCPDGVQAWQSVEECNPTTIGFSWWFFIVSSVLVNAAYVAYCMKKKIKPF